jgi:hypothetical protein
MKTGNWLPCGAILLSGPSARTATADMVPPAELLIGMSLIALVVLGIIVAAVVGVAIAVIRAVRKSLASRKDAG